MRRLLTTATTLANTIAACSGATEKPSPTLTDAIAGTTTTAVPETGSPRGSDEATVATGPEASGDAAGVTRAGETRSDDAPEATGPDEPAETTEPKLPDAATESTHPGEAEAAMQPEETPAASTPVVTAELVEPTEVVERDRDGTSPSLPRGDYEVFVMDADGTGGAFIAL